MPNLNTLKYVSVTTPITIDDTTPIAISGTLDEITNVVNIEEIDEVVNIQNVEVLGEIRFNPDPYIDLMLGNYINNSAPFANTLPKSIYGRTTTIDGVIWRTICPDTSAGIGVIALAPAAGVAGAVSANWGPNAIVDFQVRIIYYQDSTFTTTSTLIISTNGENKVSIPFGGLIYRIDSMTFYNPSGNPVPVGAEFYIYDNALVPVAGVPPSYFDMLRVGSDIGFSNHRETLIYYTPPNKTSIINSFVITVNQGDGARREIMFRMHSPIVPGFNPIPIIFEKLLYITNANWQTLRPFDTIPAGHTLDVLARQASGPNSVDLSIQMNLILVDI